MFFRVLGPLDLLMDGQVVGVGGPKPRALITALLLRRGTVVPTDALADAVWGDEVPPGAASALRAHVSRIRGVLDDASRLDFRAGGYVLCVEEGEYDVAEAERVIAAARTAEPADALELYDRALALWRGDALAEFADRDFAEAEAARLAELRRTAEEERVDALLALGRGSEAVADLEATVRRFPNRERPAVQLMQALYAAGRQSDALAAFHALRERLDEEMGVEPSEPARSLYLRILEQDPALTPARPAPGNLPRRATSFIGRGAEVEAVREALAKAPLVTITGPGGVGKSRLALQAAARDRDAAPDGVWLCELAPLSDGSPIGHAVAAALGIRQRAGLSIEERVVEYLSTRRLLLILDNCEHVLDSAAALAARLLAHCPDVSVLATSRERLGVDGEQVWPVPALSAADAAELFAHRARAQRPDFPADDPDVAAAVTGICGRLDGLPLAIELAAARTGAMSAVEIAERLDAGGLLSGGPRAAEPRHRSLDAAIGWSYDLLAPPERDLFRRLSVFAGGFDLEAAHGVCGQPGGSDLHTLDALTALVDRSMVVTNGATRRTRYRVLETLRAFGRDRIREDGAAADLARRHAEYYADLANRAARGAHGPAEREWIERVLPDSDNFRVAFGYAERTGDADLALRIVAATPEVLHVRVGFESGEWAERALSFADPAHPLYVVAVGAAARAAWNKGALGRARAPAGLAEDRVPAPGTARVAYAVDVRADVALVEGDAEFARRHYEAECARARETGEPVRLVWTLYYLAVCSAVLRNPEAGRVAAEESVEVAERCGNPTARSMGQYALGLVQKKSEPQLALARFDEAARLAAEVHNFWWEGIALMEAAATRGVHGDPAAAARAFLAVLDHWDRVGDWTQQWLNLRYVARLLARIGADEAAGTVHRALVAAGRPSPLTGRPDGDGPVPTGPQAVAFARSVLARAAG
ncbi:BTAD domain-containing putative transcriptional regulator [Sporichthya polymorpha]|uniref:BTAD domain-containing putative transcriptional regulator n=1 Tax=Sporichthya polymorpha TaxID=35751 RepID=UPI00036CAB7A|nr:BTAD domain-containing putative transcriptional regulator [Sporichthya polymorpha]